MIRSQKKKEKRLAKKQFERQLYGLRNKAKLLNFKLDEHFIMNERNFKLVEYHEFTIWIENSTILYKGTLSQISAIIDRYWNMKIFL